MQIYFEIFYMIFFTFKRLAFLKKTLKGRGEVLFLPDILVQQIECYKGQHTWLHWEKSHIFIIITKYLEVQ